MHPNPWNWSCADVQEFFRERACDYISDRPHDRLPDLQPFLRSLNYHDVNGAALLEEIDSATLRDDFDIPKFGVRATILHCIKRLKAESEAYNARSDQHELATSRSIPTHNTQAPPTPNETAFPSTETIGENLRTGEFQVHDARGRKRRKLGVLQTEPVGEGEQTLEHASFTVGGGGYLGDSAVDVDELFYGQTHVGEEVGDLQPAGNILVSRKAHEADLENETFQFSYQPKTAGEVNFVYVQMRYFLRGAETISVRRRNRLALAILPYRDRTQPKPRSATVLQFTDDREDPVAIHEHAVDLGTGYNPEVQDQESTGGEWDFLIQKHKVEDDPILPLYGESETGDDESQSFTAEEEAEQEDIAKTSTRVSDLDRVSQVVEGFVKECIAQWHQRLPELEAKQAWSVWKKTKRSRIVREFLIQGAKERIRSLSARLNNQKTELQKAEWQSEQDLLGSCEIMEPTIEDREEQEWKISVWKSRKEPPHIIKHTSQTKGSAFYKPAPSERSRGFVVSAEDRFNTSPARDALANNEDTNGYTADDEGVHLSTENAQPTVHDTFITGGEAILQSMDANREDNMDQRTDMNLQMPDTDTERSTDRLQRDTSYGDKNSCDENGDTSRIRGKGRFVLSSSSPFPTSQRKRRWANSGLGNALVDLTLSSDSQSSPPTRKGRKTGVSTNSELYAGDPSHSTRADVEAWDYNHLIKRNDKQRLLIKILLAVIPEKLDGLAKDFRVKAFSKALRTALECFRDNSLTVQWNIVDYCARYIYLPWVLNIQPEDVEGLESNKIDWALVLNNQIDLFAPMLQKFLLQRNSKIFIAPKSAAPLDSIIVINSEDDEKPGVEDTPHRKRKKDGRQDASAIESRRRARERKENYDASIQLQNTNSSQLGAMAAGDLSGPEIVINPAKSEDQPFIYIHPKIARRMKPYQIDGVRFLWRELTARGEGGGQGALLAHTMGLGKTMQSITLLTAIAEVAKSEDPKVYEQLPVNILPKVNRDDRQLRMMVLSPPTLLMNWWNEIEQWGTTSLGNVFVIDTSQSTKSQIRMLRDWHHTGGVLLIGYHLFRGFVHPSTERDPESSEAYRRIVLDGPDIVVADEAHLLKNANSLIATAANLIRTEARIALTGTPMSNDMQEIYSLVSWIAPRYLGDRSEFNWRYGEPIAQGLYHDSTPYEVRNSIKKLKVLHDEIQPKVHRADITALRASLKPKVEFLITVPLTTTQRSVYKRYLEKLLGGVANTKISQVTMFGWLALLTLLNNHPQCFRKKLLTPAPQPKSKGRQPTLQGHSEPSPTALEPQTTAVPGDEHVYALGFTDKMVQEIVEGLDDNDDPKESSKVCVFLAILENSLRCGDKVLVFSMSIPTLEYLDRLLRHFEMRFARIDGSIAMKQRMSILKEFHNNKFDILLISTRAGGQGLNIPDANRVVIFDFGFNPTLEEQAIGRAYRLGQQKPVYVYRFIAGGTFETNIYNLQLFKSSLASRVVDKRNPRRTAERNTREYLYEPKPVPQQDLSEWIGKDPEVLDKILQSHRSKEEAEINTHIRAISTMETLQQDTLDAPLTAEEQQEVDEQIRVGREQRGSRGLRGRNMNNWPPTVPTSSSYAGRPAPPPPPTAHPAFRESQLFPLPLFTGETRPTAEY